jgi:uncharacterized protein YmfQ (DUF2313 family)
MEMMTYLPPYYATSQIMRSILQSEGVEMDSVRLALDEILDQFFVKTATWWLWDWEVRVGLDVVESDPLEIRRSRVMARIRSKAKFSRSMLESVAEAYTHKPVNVTVDAATSTVLFSFDSAFITNASFYEQIEDVIQAHLLPKYQGSWLYDHKVNFIGQYVALSYPFQAFASEQLFAGTKYDGQPVRQEVNYIATEQLKASFVRTIQPYELAGNLLLGGTETANETAIFNAEESAIQTYGVITKVYQATGAVNAGTEVLV